MNTSEIRTDHDTAQLPDFCSLPVLFALLLVAGLTASVMLLAPGSDLHFSGYSTAALLAVWLALINAVLLCKLRAPIGRLPGTGPYLVAWLVIVVVALTASALVWWLDHALQAHLTPHSARRFIFGNTAIAALIGAALLRYFYVMAQWQARLRAVSRAQVEALQARIRPHFLFNSMNTVAALVRVDPAAAERTVEDLADLFRAALNSEGTGTLAEELELVERYLAIEQLRLGPRLRIERDFQTLPDTMALPRLLLQPLVENAVHHGIQPRRDGGTLRMRARCRDGALELSIDNPMPVEPAARGNGHGLDSVRQRVAFHFGARGSVETRIAAEKHPAAAHPDAGACAQPRFTVTLRLPLEANLPHLAQDDHAYGSPT